MNRCAIYTRKSTEEGLDQEFNSLDAQRESGEAYISSQQHEGWKCLATRYDDGGFTGGNTDRPALRRLLADIDAGRIDTVVVYKVDRLSRSLLDFAKILEKFEEQNVSFVSVTQQLNTSDSTGRLMLNILLSFAQFEREMISERTRDKMAAARRKGKYVGGPPILGYDLNGGLVINDTEAEQVREIFRLYLEHQSLLATTAALDRRGWKTKAWTTKKGKSKGGLAFNKSNLYGLLTNVAYIGQIKYKAEVHEGRHEGIVDPDVFQRVNKLLQSQSTHRARNKSNALLNGLLKCRSCDCAMTHSYSSKQGTKRYRYYVCVQAQKRGWQHCPTKSIPAYEVEQFVLEQIRGLGQDPKLIRMTLAETQRQVKESLVTLATEQRWLERENSRVQQRQLVTVDPAHRAELCERLLSGERRLTEIREQRERLRAEVVDEKAVISALREFDAIWQTYDPAEKSRILKLLIEKIEYDGEAGTVCVTYRPTGFQQFAEGLEAGHAG